MTPIHGFIITVTFTAMFLCGRQSECGPHMKDMKELAMIVLSGTIGNALNGNGRKVSSNVGVK